MKLNFLNSKGIYSRLFLGVFALSLVLNSCRTDSANLTESVSPLQNQMELDLSNFDLSDGISTSEGKIWKETFNNEKKLEIGIFKFNHNSLYSKSWGGFTVSNSADNSKQTNWVDNQWGTMPKHSSKGNGKPFLVSYADHIPASGILKQGEVVDLTNFSSYLEITDNSKIYNAHSINVAMSPWAYYGITDGDAYARKFAKGDYFALHIYGLDKDKKLIKAEPIKHYFVDFRNEVTEISKQWKSVDISSLGEIKYLLFFLETTDVGKWGANTALYFTMDNIKLTTKSY